MTSNDVIFEDQLAALAPTIREATRIAVVRYQLLGLGYSQEDVAHEAMLAAWEAITRHDKRTAKTMPLDRWVWWRVRQRLCDLARYEIYGHCNPQRLAQKRGARVFGRAAGTVSISEDDEHLDPRVRGLMIGKAEQAAEDRLLASEIFDAYQATADAIRAAARLIQNGEKP